MLFVAMILVTLALFTGCSFRQVAVNKLGDALSKEGRVYATDDDPELIKGATPFSLRLLKQASPAPSAPRFPSEACSLAESDPACCWWE
jgi:hypothetical protein